VIAEQRNSFGLIMMNYFSSNSAAERYARGRPYFHPMLVRRIKAFLSISEPVFSALDIGCGTGFSTISLKEIAHNITGVDASAEMIAFAPKENGIRYFVALAEDLPFEESEFNLITLSQVFHWLDRNRFFSEAHRVLLSKGWLVAYDNYFSGEMINNSTFHSWYKQEYLMRYPAPPRAKMTFTDENTHPHGFNLVKEDWYENTIKFSVEELVNYLVTQSNVIAVVEGGTEVIEEVRGWLMGVVEPMFEGVGAEEFAFRAPIWYLQRAT
jgi:ubiquinone/menaquinone biosynthesis C-methylase UbiE